MYTREGCRGGREQFKWDTLKDQDFKDREQYLGATMKVGLMAKFGKYYVHDWYAKKRDTAESIEDERQAVQEYEEELMQEALGLKPKKLLIQKKQLSGEEIAEILKPDTEKSAEKGGRELMGPQKGTMVSDANGQDVEASVLYSDSRIDGLGFAAHRNAKLEKYKAETLGTESKLEGIKCETIKLEVKSEPIKLENMTDTECLNLGGASSSSSGLKKEEKGEIKIEGDVKPEDDSAVKPEGELKDDEVKNEPPDAAKKRKLIDVDEDPEERKQRKAEKKSKKDKKQKKAEKKAKKKVKKAAKKVKKNAKLAAKLEAQHGKAHGRSSDSSDSSSSSKKYGGGHGKEARKNFLSR